MAGVLFAARLDGWSAEPRMTVAARDLARLSALLDEAMPLTRSQREAWLAALPPADASFAEALRDVLETSEGDDAGLATLPRVMVDETIARAGESIGPYRLIRELARGGMGSVWVAERSDGALRRRVALKLPRLAWGTGLARRMARERDIGARLERPHIARLYDAGVDARGRPYLAFELIDGARIDEWCQKQALSARARLKLFLQVAQAVAYAHARLVVHRDLKPSNVLVSADGQVHLLDFGIAKLLQDSAEDTGLTRELGQAMTPGYASPEQRRGEPVTVASDVYSLGVLLHELLTGCRPGDAAQTAPAQALGDDVDAILAQALQRAPEARYATVDAMADDVRRHLEGEPVNARPATAWYRVSTALRRSRTGLALGSVAAISVLAAALLSLEKAKQANEEAARASAVKEFVLDTFRVDTTVESVRPEPLRAPREYLLQRGAGLIDDRFGGQPALQAELHGVVSTLFAEMGDYELAQAHAARRLDALARAEAPAADKALAGIAVSQALQRVGRAEDSERAAAQALEWSRGDPRLAISARLQHIAALAAQAKPVELRGELARLDAQIEHDLPPRAIERALALDAHAALAALTGDSKRRVAYAEQAVATAAAIEGTTSRQVLNLRWSLWRTLIELRRVDAARTLGATIVADLRQLGGPRDSTAAFAELYTTAFLFANDAAHRLSFDDAEPLMLADREIVKARGCRGIPQAGAWSDYFLGWLYAEWHDFDRAAPLLRDAIERIAPAGEAQALIPYAESTLAWTRIVRGDVARGDEALQDQLERMTRQGSALAPQARASLATSLGMQGRGAEAVALLGPAPDAGADAPAGDPRALEVAVARAGILVDQGEADAALGVLPSPEALAALPGADGGRRGEALCRSGRTAEGLAALDAWIATEAPRHAPASPFVARSRAVEGLCELSLGHVRTASALARQSRHAFTAMAAVNPWFQEPLRQLEGALAARVRP